MSRERHAGFTNDMLPGERLGTAARIKNLEHALAAALDALGKALAGNARDADVILSRARRELLRNEGGGL